MANSRAAEIQAKTPAQAEAVRRVRRELIVAEMKRGGGLISSSDLAAYRPVWRKPLSGDYRGYRIVSMPLPSSGGDILIEFLNMLEEFDPRPLQSPAQVHLFAEIAKRAFAETERLYLELAKNYGKKVLLVDADQQKGCIAVSGPYVGR